MGYLLEEVRGGGPMGRESREQGAADDRARIIEQAQQGLFLGRRQRFRFHAQNWKRLWHGVAILERQGTAQITLDSSIARAEEGRPDADEGAPLGDGRIQVGAHSH